LDPFEAGSYVFGWTDLNFRLAFEILVLPKLDFLLLLFDFCSQLECSDLSFSVAFHEKFVSKYLRAAEQVTCVPKNLGGAVAWGVFKEDHFVSVPVFDGTNEKGKPYAVLNLYHFAAFFLDHVKPECLTVDDVLKDVTVGHIAGTFLVFLKFPFHKYFFKG
jgi:hypothetical protein